MLETYATNIFQLEKRLLIWKHISSWKRHFELGNIGSNLETSLLSWKHILTWKSHFELGNITIKFET